MGTVDLSPQLQQEYQELKVDADEQTYDDRKELSKARDLAQSSEDSLKLLTEQVAQMEEQQSMLRSRLDDVRNSPISCALTSSHRRMFLMVF